MLIAKKISKGDLKLFINIGLTFLLKGMSLLISFFSMPLYIKYFNNDTVLGFWYTILSILNFINIFDLGLGNGLRNKLVDSYEKNDVEKAKECISSSYFIVAILTVILLIVGVFVVTFMDGNTFFNIDISLISSKTMKYSLIVLLITLLLNFFLKLINSILYALQLPAINNFLYLATSLIMLFYVIFAKSSDNVETNLIKFSYVNLIAMNLPLLITTICIFATKLKNMTPSIKCVNKKSCKNMLNMSLSFFFAQISFMLLVSSNEIFITRLYGANYVVEYNVYYKVYTIVGSLIVLALGPVWSYITKLITENNYLKIKKYNNILNLVVPITFLIQIIVVVLFDFIVKIWLKEVNFDSNIFYSIVFALYGTVYVYNCVVTTIANSFGKVLSQTIFYSIGMIFKLVLSILLCMVNVEWIGVVIIVTIVLFVFCLFQTFWTNRLLNKKVKENEILKGEL